MIELLLIILLIVLVVGLDWLLTCGIVKILSLCFGFVFSWKIATGVWIIIIVIQILLKNIMKVGSRYGD